MKTLSFLTTVILFFALVAGASAKQHGNFYAEEHLQPNAVTSIFDATTGFAYKEKLEDLLIKLNDPDPFVRVEAVQSLGEIEKEQSLVLVCECLDDTNLYVRAYAAESLGKIGKLDVSLALSRLLPALQDPSPYVRAMVVATLGELEDKRATDQVKKMLKDEDGSVRGMAQWALNRIENSQ